MRASIVTTPIGCFGVKGEKIISYVRFSNNPTVIAKKLLQSKEKMIPEEKQVENELKKKGFTDIKKGDNEFIRANLLKLALGNNFVKNQIEFNKLIAQVNIELTKKEIKKAIKRDTLVIQVNGAIEELDKSINILIERLREWYGLHFPEMDKIVSKHKKFAKIIEKFGSRDKIEDAELSYFKEKSMGMEFYKDDVKAVQSFAKAILSLYDLREELSKYCEELLKDVAPNLTELAGPPLAAKLVSLAGGLEKLARMPSSTIQLLGAEKSLFRHLHGKGKSPKHGIIITHPYMQRVPLKHRGKVARLIASKLSIASKLDFYSKEKKWKELKKDLEDKIKETLKRK